MMKLKKYMRMTPKRYLCPFCGKWHEWSWREWPPRNVTLGEYAELWCPKKVPNAHWPNYFAVNFKESYAEVEVSISYVCWNADFGIETTIPFSSISILNDSNIIKFELQSEIEAEMCYNCQYKKYCNCIKLGRSIIKNEFGFEF